MKDLTVNEKLAAARLKVGQRMPYLKVALQSMVPRPAPGIGTTAVTRDLVFLYDPEIIDTWDLEEVSFAVAHEVSHVLRNHCDRAITLGIHPTSRDAQYFNLASDAVLNEDLIHAGFSPYEKDPTYEKLDLKKNLTTEQAFIILKKRNHPLPEDNCCGSGSGHEHKEEQAHVQESDKRSKGQIKNIRKQVANSIKSSKHVNGVPGGWNMWADLELKPPKVPWQKILNRSIRASTTHTSGAVRHQYDRPSKRQAGIGYGPGKAVMPGLAMPVPDLLVAIDTSFSMSEQLQTAISEVQGILRTIRAKVDFMAIDCQVQSLAPIQNIKNIKELLKGGGGTNFNPIFENIKHKYNAVIVITDGYGPAPENPPPGINVIWLLVGNYVTEPTTWGTYIRVENE